MSQSTEVVGQEENVNSTSLAQEQSNKTVPVLNQNEDTSQTLDPSQLYIKDLYLMSENVVLTEASKLFSYCATDTCDD